MTSTTIRVGLFLALTFAGAGCAGLLSIEEGTLASDSGGVDTSTGDTVGPDTATPDTGITPDTTIPDTSTTLETGVDTGAGPVVPKSCAAGGDGLTNCGPGESCCTSSLVDGGTFSRSYDGVSSGYTDPTFKATVSDFRLDKYEITVGRFRQFVRAVVSDKWLPPTGSGKHTHLNGGSGLAAPGGTFEAGWDSAWNTSLPNLKATWDSAPLLGCSNTTWTSEPSTNERRPINCINWHQAAAFCIWDGGFLPSEAEWNYAASGGNDQRAYPWSDPPSSTTINGTLVVYAPPPVVSTPAPLDVGSKPLGNGKYGQSDLSGNLWEWTLDYYKTTYNESSCTNCAYLVPSSDRVIRGGSCGNGAALADLLSSFRYNGTPTRRDYTVGARCARRP